MKTLTTRFMIAVVALAAAAGSASAQTYKAEIPMAFHAGSKLMAPGSYELILTTTTGYNVVRVRSSDGKESVFLLSTAGSDAPKAWRADSTPKIGFECSGRNCSLTQLYDGSDIATYRFSTHKLPAAEAERAAIVTVALTRAD